MRRRLPVYLPLLALCAAMAYVLIAVPRPADGRKVLVPAARSACTNRFTKGGGDSLFVFCVTANGNVTRIAFNGVEQIQLGVVAEGYVLRVGGVLKAYDVAIAESGFQAPTVNQPGGPNTLPLTITRKTTVNSMSVAQLYASGVDSVTVTTNLAANASKKTTTVYRRI